MFDDRPGNGREDLRQQADAIAALQEEVAGLRRELARLDADLDESRRLNLRAAELLDVVYTELGRAVSAGSAPAASST